MFRVLCFEHRIVTIEYFMDEMELYEINTIIKDLKYTDRTTRELSRYEIYAIAQSNSSKKLKMTDIMELPWDEEGKNKGTKVDEEQAKTLKDRMKMLEKQIQNTQLVELGNGELLKKHN